MDDDKLNTLFDLLAIIGVFIMAFFVFVWLMS